MGRVQSAASHRETTVTEEAVRAELTALTREVAASIAKQETWAKTHDERLASIEENQRLTNNELHNIMTEVNVVQNRCVDRGRRISVESERVARLEARLRKQEDTGVHHLGEAAGAEKARKATRKGFLFAFAILGAISAVTGLVFGAIKLAG